MATLDIVIVNWNAGTQLRTVLESIQNSDLSQHLCTRVVVVDNASVDGSVDQLDGFDLPLAFISNDTNLGFGVACNQGAAKSQADYLLFLNPDIRLEKRAIAEMLTFMDDLSNQHIGVVGGQLLDVQGKVSRSCDRFLSPMRSLYDAFGLSILMPNYFPGMSLTDWDHEDDRPVDVPMGAMYCMRRSLFEELGGFDERFFMYMEDMDLSLRALQAGYKSYYYTKARAFHKGGGTTDQIKARRLALILHSRLIYVKKHFGLWQLAFIAILTLGIEPFTRLIFSLVLRRSLADAGHVLRGYGLLWKRLFSVGKTREFN